MTFVRTQGSRRAAGFPIGDVRNRVAMSDKSSFIDDRSAAVTIAACLPVSEGARPSESAAAYQRYRDLPGSTTIATAQFLDRPASTNAARKLTRHRAFERPLVRQRPPECSQVSALSPRSLVKTTSRMSAFFDTLARQTKALRMRAYRSLLDARSSTNSCPNVARWRAFETPARRQTRPNVRTPVRFLTRSLVDERRPNIQRRWPLLDMHSGHASAIGERNTNDRRLDSDGSTAVVDGCCAVGASYRQSYSRGHRRRRSRLQPSPPVNRRRLSDQRSHSAAFVTDEAVSRHRRR